ncbi:hypothetical protein vBEcoMWL3_gp121 [Escherichia phage vB_EcoM_WL-3]|nr:hypothetical protein vBEcoMWL3_gp121 [Escherichia phage vB_EcoM_WL-3]
MTIFVFDINIICMLIKQINYTFRNNSVIVIKIEC